MKYKVGDKVKIVGERAANMNSGGRMDMYLGTIMTIDRIEGDRNSPYATYYMKEDNNKWCWTDNMIKRKIGIKTYQILENIDNNYKKVKGKKYRLIKSSNNLKSISVGDTAYVGKTWGGEYGLLDNKNNLLIADLTGFEEWEKVADRSVSFMELLELIERTGRARLKFSYEDTIEGYKFIGCLDDFLESIGDTFTSDYIAEKLLRGKFYIED